MTATRWLPTVPPVPCPDLLTDEQAIAFLQVGASDTKHPLKTLAYYRSSGKLRGVRLGRAIVYPIGELERFVRELWDEQHPKFAFPEAKA